VTLTRLVALLILIAIASLTPLAHASPPDPTWVAGLWDDGDHDDVILLVCATAAAMHSALPTLDSRRAVVGVVTGLDPDAPPFRAAAPVATRAPPRV
jgi:hypothetical protein